MERAVLIQCDGVINVDKPIKSAADFNYLPGAREGLRNLQEQGFFSILLETDNWNNLTDLDLSRIRESIKADLLIHGVSNVLLCSILNVLNVFKENDIDSKSMIGIASNTEYGNQLKRLGCSKIVYVHQRDISRTDKEISIAGGLYEASGIIEELKKKDSRQRIRLFRRAL